MTMGDDSPVSSLVFPVLIRPILEKLEHRDSAASQTLRAALAKVEASHPGFTHDFVLGLVHKADLAVNINESILRLQGTVSEMDEYRSNRPEDVFQELNRKAVSLKKILSKIPEEINDRKAFLETIKEIASAIKKLLDAVNDVTSYIPETSGRQVMEQRKREFVKFSKKFSTTLKDFFRDGQANAVFVSATHLINHTNLIMVTVKERSE